MEQLLSPQNLILLVGGALLAASVLTLGVYFLQRSFTRTLKPDKPRSARVRVEDETAFAHATVGAVITQLKADQKRVQEELAAAERRAEENARKFEILAREIDLGLIIFDSEGFITFSNPSVRRILAVDTWARRRYREVFNDLPGLLELTNACVETGTEVRKQTIELPDLHEGLRRVEVSVLPARAQAGALQFIACVFREAASAPPDTSR